MVRRGAENIGIHWILDNDWPDLVGCHDQSPDLVGSHGQSQVSSDPRNHSKPVLKKIPHQGACEPTPNQSHSSHPHHGRGRD
jgi:hypothetical protein